MSLEWTFDVFVIFEWRLGLDMFFNAVKIVTLERKAEQEACGQARKDSILWT